MAAALRNPLESDKNLEAYGLIWLDASVNSVHENRQAQQQLRSIINYLLTFENEQQCYHYIKNLSQGDRIILIASGSLGRVIVPQIVDLQQIVSIYIYCFDKKANQQWSSHYTKVNSFLFEIYFFINYRSR